MKLLAFRVTDFRSVNDNGEVTVGDRTVLVGRNESGKTALLRALAGINPLFAKPGGESDKKLRPFTLASDFPRDRPRSEFSDSIRVCWTRWSVEPQLAQELQRVWPQLAGIESVVVERQYAARREVTFQGVATQLQQQDKASAQFSKEVSPELEVLKKTAELAEPVQQAIATLAKAAGSRPWTHTVADAVNALRTAMGNANTPMSESLEKPLRTLAQTAQELVARIQNEPKAKELLLSRLPVLVFVDEWDSVEGQHNLQEYITRKSSGSMTGRDRLLEKLLKIAELDAEELISLLNKDHQERTLLTDRASRLTTKRLREIWKDREIEVQFRVDGVHFDTLVRDKESVALVALDERSRGFRWYFSFYVTFTADTLDGDKANAVLLLDEPGLFLHALAQRDLMNFVAGLKNQVIYTTHSPFMVNPHELANVRTVNLLSDKGTITSGELVGDDKTLFPLQAALGYDLTQTLFVGTKNVIVEGVTDFWMMDAASAYLSAQGQGNPLLKDITLTPAGGATKVAALVALLTAQHLNVVVLLDREPQADAEAKDLATSKLIRDRYVLSNVQAFAAPVPPEADVEDVIDPAVYMALAKAAFAKELAGKTLTLNDKIPRIVKRLEAGFEAIGLEYNKSRAARLFAEKVSRAPQEVMTPLTCERFSRLFSVVNSAVDAVAKRNAAPFK